MNVGYVEIPPYVIYQEGVLVGISIDIWEKIADVVGIASRTARLDWQMARAWLRREMDAEAEA